MAEFLVPIVLWSVGTVLEISQQCDIVAARQLDFDNTALH